MSFSDFDQQMRDAIVPLCEAGFSLHWLHPRKKRPIGDDWQKRPVASLDLLRATQSPGNNLGVRLGEHSRLIDGSYLHVIDFDIRLPDLADECWAAFEALFPGIRVADFPLVESGSGGESRHLYFTTSKPFYGKKLAHSEGKHRRIVDGKEVWSWDWEIDLFGTTRQVAIPPSIHPDTGRQYRWVREFDFAMLAIGVAPAICADRLAEITSPSDETYAFETREPLTFKDGQLERVLSDIPVYRIDDRNDWVMLGQALHHQFGGSQEGFDLWMKHSARGSKYLVGSSLRAELRRYRGFGKNRRAPVTMATVVDWAKQSRLKALLDQFDDGEDGDAFEGADTLPAPAAPEPADFLGSMFGEPAAPAKPKTVRETLPGFDDDDEDDGEDDDTPAPAAAADPFDDLKEASKPSSNLAWTSLLAVNKDGEGFASNLHNMELIICNDPRLTGLPQMNLFTKETVQRTAPGRRSKKRKNAAKEVRQLGGRIWEVKDTLNGENWTSERDYAIRSIIEAPQTQGGYGIKVSDRDLKAATVLAAWENCFHPIQEYLDGLKWDGVSRVDSLFVDYLGVPDNFYARDVARMMMVAAVTRVFEPGHKWDYAVILEGLQGRGKSSFIRTLGKSWYCELEGDFHNGKEMVEKMQNSWIIEMPELSGFNRADVRSIKAFISRPTDKVRLAYEARASDFPRQCVLIGSTNDREYLKDDTGGRRFFPMECHVDMIDIPRLRANIDQLWAEAREIYRQMRAETPMSAGELPLYLTTPESALEAARLQEIRRVESADDGMAGRIAAWLDRPISTGSLDDDTDENGQQRFHEEVCLLQIWVECLGNDAKLYNQQNAQSLGRAMTLVCKMSNWEQSGQRKRFDTYGLQRVYKRRN